MKKGDIVYVNATVFTKDVRNYSAKGITQFTEIAHHPDFRYKYDEKMVERPLCRSEYSEPWIGLVIGYSTRQTGWLSPSWYSEEYKRSFLGSLNVDKVHTVWMVTPLSNQRFTKPFACLEADLEYLNPEDDPEYDPIAEENFPF